MCKAVVMVVDKIGADPYVDARSFKRGDVVDVVEDDHVFGKEEANHPQWRIFSFPGVSASEMRGFMAHEPETDPSNPSAVLQLRAFGLDLTKLKDDASFAAIMAARIRKPPLVDPNVL
jgi:hypothetical protein